MASGFVVLMVVRVWWWGCEQGEGGSDGKQPTNLPLDSLPFGFHSEAQSRTAVALEEKLRFQAGTDGQAPSLY